jgi:hypothetical protein
MTAIVTTGPTLSVDPAVEAAPRSLVRAGIAAGLVAAAAASVVVVVAKAAGVPMLAAPGGAAAGKDIPLWAFATSTLMATVIGIVLAAALARWVKRATAVFVGPTTALTVLSFAGPITTGHATTATRLVLALTHVVAAAIVIPTLAARVAARSART